MIKGVNIDYKEWHENSMPIADMRYGQHFIDISGNHWEKIQHEEENENLVWAKSVRTGRTDCFAKCAYASPIHTIKENEGDTSAA